MFYSFGIIHYITELPLSRFIRLKETEEIVKLFVNTLYQTFVKICLQHIILMRLFPSLAYMGTIQAQLAIPNTTKSEMDITALVVLCALCSLSVMQNIHLQESKEYKRNTQEGTFG